MTSTRNKNTQLNYNLEKFNIEKLFNENLYLHSSSGRPISECIPALGYMPSHISREALSNNSIDIESPFELFVLMGKQSPINLFKLFSVRSVLTNNADCIAFFNQNAIFF